MAQRGVDGVAVGRKPIGGDLEALTGRDGIAEAFDKSISGRLITAAKCEVDNHLRVALDGNEAVGIADALIARSICLLVAIYVAPKVLIIDEMRYLPLDEPGATIFF